MLTISRGENLCISWSKSRKMSHTTNITWIYSKKVSKIRLKILRRKINKRQNVYRKKKKSRQDYRLKKNGNRKREEIESLSLEKIWLLSKKSRLPKCSNWNNCSQSWQIKLFWLIQMKVHPGEFQFWTVVRMSKRVHPWRIWGREQISRMLWISTVYYKNPSQLNSKSNVTLKCSF